MIGTGLSKDRFLLAEDAEKVNRLRYDDFDE